MAYLYSNSKCERCWKCVVFKYCNTYINKVDGSKERKQRNSNEQYLITGLLTVRLSCQI